MAATHAWDIYAKALFHHGHGYPLWAPDPERIDGTEWEVEIADVGWLREGAFMHLLRTRYEGEQGEGVQPRKLLPDDYTSFDPPNVVKTGPTEKITQPVLYSQTIKNVEVTGGASVNIPLTPTTPGGNIKFQCMDERGALLLLSPSGEETYISSRRHIHNYLREHLDHWEEFANGPLGLELPQEEIYFVSGVTKTARWGVAAFHGSQSGAQGNVSCDLGALGSAQLSLSIANSSRPGIYPSSLAQTVISGSSTSISTYATTPEPLPSAYNTVFGGTDAQFMPSVPAAVPGVPDRADQCIFIHYYKAKRRSALARRLFGMRLAAAAGPHALPPRDPYGDADSSSPVLADDGSEGHLPEFEFEMVPDVPSPYDPVNEVLKYILEKSDAEIAIASDLDLYALFKACTHGREFPEDVAEALIELDPKIEVDESGAGTLSLDLVFARKREGEELEGSPNKKPAHGDTSPTKDADMEVDSHTAMGLGNVPGTIPYIPQLAPPPHVERDPEEEKEHAHILGGDLSTHEGAVTALAYSADGRYLASGAEDTSIILWYAREGTVKCKFAAHDDTVSALAFSPNGALLASASDFGPVKLWQVEALSAEPQTLDAGVFIRTLAFTPDGSKLLGGAADGTFLAWNLGNLEQIHIDPHGAVINFIVFSPNGTLMATGGTETSCRIWEVAQLDRHTGVASGPVTPKFMFEHQGMVTSASFAPDGRRVVTGCDDGTCHMWSTESGALLMEARQNETPVWSVAFSPDGRRFASGSSDATVTVYDAWKGNSLFSLIRHNHMINAVAYSPDGRFLASAASDNTLRLWRAEDGELVRTYNEHSDNVTFMAFSPDGKTIASGSHDGSVHIRQLPARVA
ncbi:WD40-repeat-containing domain protein [Trametes polyzona]|nr:WD40-repeat-containing domain protein [Trametes polyzona]